MEPRTDPGSRTLNQKLRTKTPESRTENRPPRIENRASQAGSGFEAILHLLHASFVSTLNIFRMYFAPSFAFMLPLFCVFLAQNLHLLFTCFAPVMEAPAKRRVWAYPQIQASRKQHTTLLGDSSCVFALVLRHFQAVLGRVLDTWAALKRLVAVRKCMGAHI